MRTALAADEPEPPRFATGGIVPAGTPPITLGCDGYVIPPEAMSTAAYPAGNVSVTFEVDTDRLVALARSTHLGPVTVVKDAS